MQYNHSVCLDEEKCKGCTNCIKRCPTQAIRVRNGKARIISDRCIDCGECIRVCPHHAKLAVTDPLSMMEEFDYTIALPAPTLYGQFNNLSDVDYILSGLIDMGFNSVFEVSRSAELVSEHTRVLMKNGTLPTPVISSACPAVVRLVKVRYPELCGLVLPISSPMQIAAYQAKLDAMRETGLPGERIGCFFISPCPAKMTDIAAPIGITKSWMDGAFSMKDIYPRLLEKMDPAKEPRRLARSGIIGVSWANSGGEASALIREQYLAADGIENIISVLEQLEDERLTELDFIELNACPGGCVGGVLTVENPYIAKARLQRLRKYMPVSLNYLPQAEDLSYMNWNGPLEPTGSMSLSPDLKEAMRMMREIDELAKMLPDLDCGSCGAPSCRALAEDIVTGDSSLSDCHFILRQQAADGCYALSVQPQKEASDDDGTIM